MSAVHWPGLMRLGLVELRLPPDQFWALTPAELFFIAGLGGGAVKGMTRSGLDALVASYPDKQILERDADGGS